MQNLEVPLQSEGRKTDRIVGSFEGSTGPTVIILGGLHGNEPAGIKAINRVIHKLENRNISFSGKIFGLAGNMLALERNERFIDEDMNRQWYRYLRRRASASSLHLKEDEERDDLIHTIEELVGQSEGPCIFFDLHSTSAPSLPFVSINDSLYNRKIVKGLPVPVILGLQEQIEGTLNGLLNDMGLPAILFEAGQHDLEETVDYHESFIWYMLYKMGCIKRNYLKNLQRHRDILKQASKGMDAFYEVTFRYPVEPEDEFKMNPGYSSFQKISNNESLGTDRRGNIRSPHADMIFMPLYQSKGEDGYFLIRRIRPVWMRISKWLRHRNMDNYIHYLPGVSEFDHDEQSFKVNQSIAFAFALQVFHLLGYRKERIIDDQLFVSRIHYDDHPPSKEEILRNFRSYLAGEH